MRAPLFSPQDYRSALQALLPRGPAWPRDADTVQARLAQGLAASFHGSNVAANRLLADAFPATADQLVPEWEATLGLSATGLTLGERQANIVDRLVEIGRLSGAYYVSLAAEIGVPITISGYVTYSVDKDVMTPLNSDEWGHTWLVTAPASFAQAYVPTVDIVQLVPGLGNPALESLLAEFKPAHTICITRYI